MTAAAFIGERPTNALRGLGLGRSLLLAVGFFGGAAHALPSRFYIAGAIGPFDILVLILLAQWLLVSSRRVSRAAVSAYLPFLLLAIASYVGDVCGAVIFGGITWSGMLAPFRFLYYPTLLVTLTPLLHDERDLMTLFMSFVLGVLAISIIAWLHSPDPTFFFGLPVLYNPNVIGNFISYAMICLGFAFMPQRLTIKGSLLGALFLLALFTFSKASVLLALIGLAVNSVKMSKVRLGFAVCFLLAASVAFVNWRHVFELLSDAIDLKIASSVGGTAGGGTLDMRIGFFRTSIYSLFDYPLGVGLKHFHELNQRYADVLGNYYFESDSPHMALGFAAVQAGWLGVVLLVVIVRKVVTALSQLYGDPGWMLMSGLVAMLMVSILFQIEFITQPFIYLVLAGAIALRQQSEYSPSPYAGLAEPESGEQIAGTTAGSD